MKKRNTVQNENMLDEQSREAIELYADRNRAMRRLREDNSRRAKTLFCSLRDILSTIVSSRLGGKFCHDRTFVFLASSMLDKTSIAKS